MIHTIFFDLDDTLIHERPTAERIVRRIGEMARARYGIEPGDLAERVFAEARALWYASEWHPYCQQIGVSSWEGLWARFAGEASQLRALREWAPAYRVRAWRNALAAQGIEDGGLAEEMAERYAAERGAEHDLMEGATDVLQALVGRYALGLITNGASDLQREKLHGAGLGPYFPVVVAAGDVESRKPGRAIFERALQLACACPAEAVMVGDKLESDVLGAKECGMRAVWFNPDRRPLDASVAPDVEIRSLAELLGWLQCRNAEDHGQ